MTGRAALTGVLLLLAVACGPSGEAGSATAEQAAPAPEPTSAPTATPEPTETEAAEAGADLAAVATVFPLAWIAQQVAPGADHTFLGARGQDPHDLELTPGDRALLEVADVVLSMGDVGLQPQVEAALAGRSGSTVNVRDVTGNGALIELGHSHDGDEHGHDGDEHGHDGESRYDPHLWFDAAVMAEAAVAAGEAFAGADPAGAEIYRANASALHGELTALAADLDALLSDCTHETAIVSHEAYAYLLEPRGLGQEGISGAGGHGEASPQRLAELTERIRAEGIPAVLAEPVEGRADAEALSREAGVPMLDIDPLEIADGGAFATGYPALLRQQAETFARALECG